MVNSTSFTGRWMRAAKSIVLAALLAATSANADQSIADQYADSVLSLFILITLKI